MSKPVVAIVGRPNVGKSTLFNVLAGEMISIVKDTPGVTRDRIYADVTWLDKEFTMIDTGGIEPESKDIILAQMREQAQIAIDTADVIIFITDVRQGLVDADSKVADMLRRSGKPVVLAVNKVDSFEKFMPDVYEFYNLGIGDPVPVSAASRLGIGDMLDAVIAHFPEHEAEEKEDERPRVAIVGKPNVGKSSLLNCLLRENRAIVTNIPGTTRDTLEEDIVIGNILLHLIDTAGIRETENEIESIGIKKTKESLEKADFVIIVLDSSKELSKEDYEILDLCKNSTGVVLVNKSDLQQTLSMQEIRNLSVKDVISFSAAKGDGLDELESYIKRQFIESKIEEKDDLYITNARQKEALVQTKDSLEKVLESIEFGMPEDLYAIDLTNAYESLGKIIGETLEEDIINKIFKDFCMGK